MAKKIPMRMCITCRERLPKKELIRIVATEDGEVTVDPTGKMPGRGAYVCKNPECLEKAVKQHRFEYGLKDKINRGAAEKLLDTEEKVDAEDGKGKDE